MELDTLLRQVPRPDLPVGGRLKFFLTQWKEITSDENILSMIRGLQISLTELPDQHKIPHEIKMSSEETVAADEMISKLLKKQAIIPWTLELDGFMNNIFMRPKKDGGSRTILNLKRFNTYIDKIHFKMETLQNILDTITPNCFIASLDLQDAFHGLGVDPKFWKYLQFTWKGQVYTYVAMPFGLTSAPRHYTKLLKPVLAHLRKAGIVIFIYLDDSWIRGTSFNSCLTAVKDSLTLMLRVGLLPHPEKSAPLPVQCIEFLGFVLDSILMQVSLTPHKTTRVIQMCVQAIERKSIMIRELAQLIGKIVSCFPATPRGRAHYRHLERLKNHALLHAAEDFDATCTLNFRCIKSL